MKEYSFILPLPPSDNALYANNFKSGKGRFQTKECKAFKKEAAYAFMEAKLPTKQYRKEWHLTIVVHMDQRRYALRDLSNCFKALIDSISSYIESDDRFLISLHASKILDKRNYADVALYIGEEKLK